MFACASTDRRKSPERRVFKLGLESLEDRRLLSAETLINLDLFRADPRFAGIDGTGMASVIIDTGVDVDHPFFGPDRDRDGVADRIVYQWDFADNDGDASDASSSGHGSHVTGIVASGDPTYPGMAPGSDIIVLKVFGDAGESAEFEIVELALQWVEANVATYNIVSVNMSLGSGNFSQPQSPPPITDELARLAAQNVIVVAATGNLFFSENSQPGVGYPAADPNVLAVGAVWVDSHGTQTLEGAVDNTTAADRIAAFSQRDPDLTDILAPGGLIPGANRNGGVVSRRGTSMAAPHISGIAVLAQQLALRELGRRLTPVEFRELLTSTGAVVNDGDDEDDNVTNTGADYRRVDVLRLGEAILVNPGLPSLTINNVTLTEGNGSSTQAVFTVRLSFIGASAVFVGYSTVDGTATLAAGDYQQTGGVLSFTSGGPLERQIVVPVTGDLFDEPNENLHVVLVDARGANIVRGQGTATIIDDDEQLTWQNPVNRRDVNNDGLIDGLDALIIINQINLTGPRFLPEDPEPRTPWHFYDVDNDGLLSALDALIIINWINARAGSAAPATNDGGDAIASAIRVTDVVFESDFADPSSRHTAVRGSMPIEPVGAANSALSDTLRDEALSQIAAMPRRDLVTSAAPHFSVMVRSVTRAALRFYAVDSIASQRPEMIADDFVENWTIGWLGDGV